MTGKSPITTHVLDTSEGKPANGVPVKLEQQANGSWKTISEKITNADGRVSDLLAEGTVPPGTYRLTFDVATYFRSSKKKSFYPYVTVIFLVEDSGSHYHVPLLLSPFGYSTYRGS